MNSRIPTIPSRTLRWPRLLQVAVLTLAVTAGVAGARASQSTTVPGTPPPAPAPAAAAASPVLAGGLPSYSGIVDQVAPAVVTIRVEKRLAAQPTMALPDELERFFGQRFRSRPEGPGVARGLGSGVIIRPDGYILTNHHVVADAERVVVDLSDGRSAVAKVAGVDPPSDLALLKIEDTGLPTVPFGDADRVKVGDVVLAFGNPLGVGQTVTMGIVSAKGRATGVGDGGYEDFLQTDAPINQGNSGGALVNLRGELVGINSQILTPSGGNIGLGFAIPSTMARAVADQLMHDGTVRRGMLGVTVQPLTPDMAESLGLGVARGAIVSAVEPGSPAERAGIRQGDVISETEGRPVRDANALRNQVAATKPGSELSLTVLRNGKPEHLTARIAERPQDRQAAAKSGGADGGAEEGRMGLAVQPLTPSLARQLGVSPEESGVVVTDVDPNGAGAAAGVREGDVIKRVNGRAVASIAELRTALASNPGRPALVLLNREGQDVFVALPERAA